VTEVRVSSLNGLAQEVAARHHRLTADEPTSAGGSDSGPDPYELLLASLGACTSMTVQLYARRQGWPLEGVEVILTHERVHAEDCAQADRDADWATRITKRLVLRGPLDEDQRLRLADISTRCPVHRALSRDICIDQELVPGEKSDFGL
jgi:putative redox protein